MWYKVLAGILGVMILSDAFGVVRFDDVRVLGCLLYVDLTESTRDGKAAGNFGCLVDYVWGPELERQARRVQQEIDYEKAQQNR